MGEITRNAGIQAECLLFIVLTSVTTLLRVISRTQSKAGLWWDDYLSILALVRGKSVDYRREQRSCLSLRDCRESWRRARLMEIIQVFVITLNALGYTGMP